MKNTNKKHQNDEIYGKECSDYIEEFSPHRLSLLRFWEDSDKIFNADEEKTIVEQ